MDIKRKLENKLIADDASLNSISILGDKKLILVYQEDNSVNHMHRQRSLNTQKTVATVSRLCGIGRRDTKINKTEDLEIDPHRHVRLIIDKGA